MDLTARDVAAWNEIRSANPLLASPYFCHEFTRLVAMVRNDVRVAILGGDSNPTGFFPFQVGPWRRGRPVGGPLSDHHGPIMAADTRFDAQELVANCGVAVWDFDHLSSSHEAFAPHATASAASPCMDLETGFADYCARVRATGSKQVNKVDAARRKLEREHGPLRFELEATEDRLLDRLMAIKSSQYRESGTADAFAHAWTRNLLRAAHATREEQFSGILSALYLGDEPIALHFGIRSTDVLHYWFPGYTAEYSRFSPGLILLLRIAEAVAERGIRRIDLGKGEALYKQRLMTSEIGLLEGTVETPSVLRTCRRAIATWERYTVGLPFKGLRQLPTRVRGRLERRRRYR